MDSSKSTAEAEAAKPRRPLTAFNLFYRYKRQRVLDALAAGGVVDREAICNLVSAPPGLENANPTSPSTDQPGMLEETRRKTIRAEMSSNLLPRDTKSRIHRKGEGPMNGAMSFVELGKLMNTSWRECDEYSKNIFRELAEEGREFYRRKMREYEGSVKEAKAAEKKRKKKIKAAKSKKKSKKSKDDAPQIPVLKDEATSARASRSPSTDVSDNETAEIMLQFTKQATSIPATISLKPKRGVSQESAGADAMSPGIKPRIKSRIRELSIETLSTALGSPSDAKPSGTDGIRQPPCPSSPPPFSLPPSGSSEDTLKSRIRELESQLEEARLRARVRELQDEVTRRNAREELIRSALENVLARSGTLALPSLASTPTGLASASMSLSGAALEPGLVTPTRKRHPQLLSEDEGAQLCKRRRSG